MVSGLEAQFNTYLQFVKADDVLLDNLIPICEQAIEENNKDIAIKCLDYFFSKEGPKSQYLCRAYNCKAVLSVPQSIFDYDGILQMGEHFIKAIEIAKSSKKYHFLVYNGSIDFMESSRPFLCPETRKYLLKPLQVISKALEDCEDTDMVWRVQIMLQLVLSLHESNRKEETAKWATVLLELARKVSKKVLRESQIFISSNQIPEQKENKYPNEVFILAKINRLKSYLLNDEYISHSDLTHILRLFSTYDFKDKSTFEQANLFSLLPLEIRELNTNLKSVIVILIGIVSILSEFLGLADECISELQQLSPLDSKTEVLYTFLILSLQAKKISGNIYSKSGLKRYNDFLLGISQQIQNAYVIKNIEAIEIGSSIFWHLSLILCQPKFRKFIKRSLQDISRILDQIGSQLYTLRSFFYRELAQCEEQDEEIDLALQHLQMSINYNNAEQWVIIQYSEISRLKLKNQLYIMPEDKLDRAVQMLDQVKYISDLQKCREILLHVGANIIGSDISPFLDSQHNHNFTTFLIEDADTILDYLDQCVNFFYDSIKQIQRYQLSPERDRLRCHLLFELSKASRKMELWDISRCACRLCLSYNDGRWGTLHKMQVASMQPDKNNNTLQSLVTSKVSMGSEHTSDPSHTFKDFDTDILINFAEAQFILAEGCVALIFKNGQTLYEIPNLLNFNLRPIYKDNQKWIKFCEWINTLSLSALDGFILATKWSLDLNQNWLVANCLACFWNYIKHKVVNEREYCILQPLRDICLITYSKFEIRPQLINFKLSIALLNALIHESHNRTSTVSTPPNPQLKKPTSRNERERKKASTNSPSNQPEPNLSMESIQILKEANEICEMNIALLSKFVLNIEIFQILVSIWVKIQKRLNVPIYLDIFFERVSNYKEVKLLRAFFIIEVLLTTNSPISDFNISITSAFENLVTSDDNNSIVILELSSKLALISLNAELHHMVISCVEHGRKYSIQLLKQRLAIHMKHKVYIIVSKLESTFALSCYYANLHHTSNEILDQILTACEYADKASNMKFVIYYLKLFWNYCKPIPKKTQMNIFLIEKAHLVLSILSNYPKINIALLLDNDSQKDIKTELFTLFLDAFIDQCSWESGLHFLELALTLINTEYHPCFVRYTILFKSKQNLNVILDILRFSKDLEQIEICNLYLLAAHESTDYQNKIDYYQGAISSLICKNHFLLKISTKLEFFRWLVMIKYSYSLIITLLEEVLSELVEHIIERLDFQKIDTSAILQNMESSDHIRSCDSDYDGNFPLDLLANFEEWTLNEIDLFFHILMLIFILYGKTFHQKHDILLKLLIFCTYNMLKLAFIQNPEIKTTIHDQNKKGKGVSKPKIEDETFLPNNLDEWSRFFPLHDNLSPSTSHYNLLECSLESPNLTLHYLNHLNKVLKVSAFSHFQIFILALMNAISLACGNCPRGWSKLSFIGMLVYAKRFNFDSSVGFWKSKLDDNYFAQEDQSFLLETKLSELDLHIDKDFAPLITFQPSHFIILISLEISKLLLELKYLQATIDIVSECEFFLQFVPNNIFDFLIYDIKIRTNATYLESTRNVEYTLTFQNSLIPITDFLESSLSLSKLLKYTLATHYLENTILFLRKMEEMNDSDYYTNFRVGFEIELATRQLNFYLSHSLIDSHEKREIIDVEITMELLFSCFCLLNASHDYIGSIYALKKYVCFLDKLTLSEEYTVYHTSYFTFVDKTLSCYERTIDLHKEMIKCIKCTSSDFDIDLDKESPIHSELVDSHLSLATFSISIFQKYTELINSEKFKINIYTQTEKNIDKFVHEDSPSNICEQFMPNIISLITNSNTILVYLQTISSCHLIGYELGRSMLSLYYYYGQDTHERGHFIVNDTDLMSQSINILLETKENDLFHSKAIRYFASGIRYFHKYLLSYIKCNNFHQQTLKELCCRFLTLIGLYDRKQSAHYLALFQSFSISSFFKSTISHLLQHHSDSKLAAIDSIDNKCSFFLRLDVLPDFFEFTKEMPSNFRYLILQHSMDMSMLYFAYTQPPPSLKGTKGVISHVDWLPAYGHCQVNSNTLQDIFLMLKDASKQNKYGNGKTIDCMTDFQISTVGENIFHDLTAAILAYFNCIVPFIEPIINSETNPQNLILFILCDESILSIPIEVIYSFTPLKLFGHISRDFSLQFLNHRYKSFQFQDKESLKDKLKEPALPITSEFEHDILDLTNTRYCIDPYNFFASHSNVNEDLQTILRRSLAVHQKLTNKWNGILGSNSYQSLYDKWNIFKTENMLFLLPGLFDSHYPLDKLLSYSKRYNLLLLFDKIFNGDPNCDIINEYCFPTDIYSTVVIAGLLSIIGCNVIVTNIWHMNDNVAASILNCFFNSIFKEGYSISKSVHCINNQYFPTEELIDHEFVNHMPYGIITYGLSYLHTI